jgi:hypothetical protein
MHASIRKYQVRSAEEFTELVNSGFVPIISQAPGFIAYYGVDTGNGTWSSVSIFETREGADESNRLAAEFVKQNLRQFIVSGPDVTEGSLVVSSMG